MSFEHDLDDPPALETPVDVYWWFANRAAENLMRFLRLFGLI